MRYLYRKGIIAGVVAVMVVLLALAGCGAGGGDEDRSADGIYEIGFRCTVDPADVIVLMDQLNAYRTEQGGEPLAWNRGPENELLTRAAELAISFTDTRLDGQTGQELRRGCFDAPEIWADELLADEAFCEALCDPDKTSLCIGIIQSWTGNSFGALDLYPKAGEGEATVTDGPTWKEDDEKIFRLKATDEHLNCRGKLLDGDMEPLRATDLFAGESYFYTILNNDPNNDNYQEELDVGYSSSMDPKVVSIDRYGWVKAVKAGTTTIEIRPAEQSGIRLQLEVTVRRH